MTNPLQRRTANVYIKDLKNCRSLENVFITYDKSDLLSSDVSETFVFPTFYTITLFENTLYCYLVVL